MIDKPIRSFKEIWDESMAKRKAAGAGELFLLDPEGNIVENPAYWGFVRELLAEIERNAAREREVLGNESS